MVISCNNDKIYKMMKNIVTNDGLSHVVANWMVT